MKRKKILPYGFQSISRDDIRSVSSALKNDFLTTGPLVEIFERQLKSLTQAKHAVACANGTAALHLACNAINLQKGDWVIVPSVTFLATANAVRFCGADVFFSDVDENTGQITPEILERAFKEADRKSLKIKAVIVVHLTGRPVNLKEISFITKKHKVTLIVDACHAIGGSYLGLPIGSCKYEDINTFSFHPVKSITTGEGGAITTNDKSLALTMKRARSHNMIRSETKGNWRYQMKNLGFNYRISDIQCALGINQLKKLDKFVQKRAALVCCYNKKFREFDGKVITPTLQDKEPETSIGWHLYSVVFNFSLLPITKSQLMKELAEVGIYTQVHYIPVHSQPYYRKLYGSIKLPGSMQYFERTLSLPLFPKMKLNDVKYVVDHIKGFIL